MNELLLKGLDIIGIPNYEEKAKLLEKYIDELMLFNPSLKLIGDKNREDIVVRHILDCAAGYGLFVEYTKPNSAIADFGSGSGLPGIVLAILLDNRNLVLVERMQRRVGFLRGVVAKLALSNVRIEDKDIKDIREDFDTLTCRAFHPLSDIAKYSVRLLRPNGYALMYKGQRKSVDRELEDLSSNGFVFNAKLERLDVPFLDEERTMCILSGWRKQ